MVDRDLKPVGVDPEFFGDQLPGKGNRVGFEIVAKAEIPQHFKEGMVARGIADIVQIIVLCRQRARISALLWRGCNRGFRHR